MQSLYCIKQESIEIEWVLTLRILSCFSLRTVLARALLRSAAFLPPIPPLPPVPPESMPPGPFFDDPVDDNSPSPIRLISSSDKSHGAVKWNIFKREILKCYVNFESGYYVSKILKVKKVLHYIRPSCFNFLSSHYLTSFLKLNTTLLIATWW